MLVIQRRFSNVFLKETEICPTLENAMGAGGNNIPMIISEVPAVGLMTITMNTYQVITKDEPIAPVLYSDYKRGGGIAIVIPKDSRIALCERICKERNAGSNEWDVCNGVSKLGWCGNVRNADIAQCERSAADAGQESF